MVLARFTAGACRLDGQLPGQPLSSLLFIIHVPSFAGELPKPSALPGQLSLGHRGKWSEVASHMLAALPECSSLAAAGRPGQQPCYLHQLLPM